MIFFLWPHAVGSFCCNCPERLRRWHLSWRRCHLRRREIITGCGCWLIRPGFLVALISVNNQRGSNPVFHASPFFLILRFPSNSTRTPSDAQILPLPLESVSRKPADPFHLSTLRLVRPHSTSPTIAAASGRSLILYPTKADSLSKTPHSLL